MKELLNLHDEKPINNFLNKLIRFNGFGMKKLVN